MKYRQDANEIEEIAARWVWRLDRDGTTPALEHELEEWLAGDPRRRGAFLQAQAMWSALDGPQADVRQAPVRRRWVIAAAASVGIFVVAPIAAFKIWHLTPER